MITRDTENAYLAFDPSEEAPIHGLLGPSIVASVEAPPVIARILEHLGRDAESN